MAANPPEFPGLRAGPWQLEERIGAGGQGEAYRATRVEGGFTQVAAVKILRRNLLTPLAQQRFAEEQEYLADLRHPFIASLFGTGILPDGRPYYAMEYVDGKPIDVYANEQALSIPQRLALFRLVCDSVSHAHQRLIVHLDLKPANILVTREGNPKLLDFGLARRVAAGAVALELDAFSRPYASPEQVTPGASLTTASDVYSLGAVLYELLTGHPAVATEGLSEEALLRNICEQEPMKPAVAALRPRLLQTPQGKQIELTPQTLSQMRASSPGELKRRLQGDLENIVLVALHKEPSRRYPSVEEMSRDIERYLGGKPVLARASSPAYTALRFARRRPLALYATALLLCALFINSVIGRAAREAGQQSEAELQQLRSALCGVASDLRGELRPALHPHAAASASERVDSVLDLIQQRAACEGRR